MAFAGVRRNTSHKLDWTYRMWLSRHPDSDRLKTSSEIGIRGQRVKKDSCHKKSAEL